jgi:hypothetical protein
MHELYFVLAPSRVTNRSPLHSSISWPDKALRLSIASDCQAQKRSRITKIMRMEHHIGGGVLWIRILNWETVR